MKKIILTAVTLTLLAASCGTGSPAKKTDSKNADSQTHPYVVGPDKVVQSFYNTYFFCVDKYYNTKANKTLKGLLADCSPDTSSDISEELKTKLKKTTAGQDPILCTTQSPVGARLGSATELANAQNSAIADEVIINKNSDTHISVSLQKINDMWQITNITCPR